MKTKNTVRISTIEFARDININQLLRHLKNRLLAKADRGLGHRDIHKLFDKAVCDVLDGVE
jgi:hypothetical protein